MTVNSARPEPLQEVIPLRRISLSDKIIEQIIDLISRNVLQPGERLPSEKDLCKRFGVGRATLREALRSLAVMGILDGRVGEGTFVSHNNQRYLERNLQWGLLLDPKKVEDLLETRLMLETQTAFSAARKATPANLKAMEGSIQGMESSLGRPDQYLRFDLEFHLLVAQATQNTILHHLVSMTRGYLQAWIEESLVSPPSSPEDRHRAQSSIREHRAILMALRSGQAEQARQAMKAHILSSSADLHRHLDKTSV